MTDLMSHIMRRFEGRLRDVLRSALFGLVVAFMIYASAQTVAYRPFLGIQNAIDDSHFLRRFLLNGEGNGASGRIVIVDIDDRSMKALGQFKLWPRRLFGTVIGNVNADGAKLVFLDVILMDGGFRGDNSNLAESIASAGNVLSGYYFNVDTPSINQRPLDSVYNERFASPLLDTSGREYNEFIRAEQIVLPYHDLVMSVKGLGFTNYIPDPDGILRHIPLFIVYGNVPYPCAALQMWLAVNNEEIPRVKIAHNGIYLGDTHIPTDRHCFMRLNFPGVESVYRTIPFVDVFNGKFDPGTFTDKIVMIGSSSEKLGDLKHIPVNRSLPGVEIHATALSTLLSREFLRVSPANRVLLITLLTGMISAVVFTISRTYRAAVFWAAGVPLVLYVYAVIRFLFSRTMVNIAIPSFVTILLFVVLIIYRIVDERC